MRTGKTACNSTALTPKESSYQSFYYTFKLTDDDESFGLFGKIYHVEIRVVVILDPANRKAQNITRVV